MVVAQSVSALIRLFTDVVSPNPGWTKESCHPPNHAGNSGGSLYVAQSSALSSRCNGICIYTRAAKGP